MMPRRLNIRLSDAEMHELKRGAARRGLKLTSYVRLLMGFPAAKMGAPVGNEYWKGKQGEKAAGT